MPDPTEGMDQHTVLINQFELFEAQYDGNDEEPAKALVKKTAEVFGWPETDRRITDLLWEVGLMLKNREFDLESFLNTAFQIKNFGYSRIHAHA